MSGLPQINEEVEVASGTPEVLIVAGVMAFSCLERFAGGATSSLAREASAAYMLRDDIDNAMKIEVRIRDRTNNRHR